MKNLVAFGSFFIMLVCLSCTKAEKKSSTGKSTDSTEISSTYISADTVVEEDNAEMEEIEVASGSN